MVNQHQILVELQIKHGIRVLIIPSSFKKLTRARTQEIVYFDVRIMHITETQIMSILVLSGNYR